MEEKGLPKLSDVGAEYMLPPPQACCPGDESVVVLHTNSTQEVERGEGAVIPGGEAR